MYKVTLFVSSFIFLVFTFKNSFSKGDLTRQKAIEVKVNLKGENGKVHFFEPSTLKFETGKLYKLKIQNLSDSKHYFTSENFSNSIFTRKIQINKHNIKVAEVKGIIKNDNYNFDLQHLIPANSVSKAELLKLIKNNFEKEIKINEINAESLVNRTLETHSKKINEQFWLQAGYENIPTVQDNIRELADSKFTELILN